MTRAFNFDVYSATNISREGLELDDMSSEELIEVLTDAIGYQRDDLRGIHWDAYEVARNKALHGFVSALDGGCAVDSLPTVEHKEAETAKGYVWAGWVTPYDVYPRRYSKVHAYETEDADAPLCNSIPKNMVEFMSEEDSCGDRCKRCIRKARA